MAANSFGNLFRITTAGESHGPAMAVIIDGCPPGLEVDEAMIQAELDRRRPGQSELTTARKEGDKVQILAGVFEGKTTGAPILLEIRNEDARSSDYDQIKDLYRPSHADYTYRQKYGHKDPRGGGRASARETANWVAAGAIAKKILLQEGITIYAGVTAVGPIQTELPVEELDWNNVETNPVRCPDPETAKRMEEYILEIKEKGDTVGGVITCVISGCPPGLGAPVFHKLDADLAHAMLSINAAKGFEIGSGFAGATMQGSAHNDVWVNGGSGMRTKTNYSGGLQAGITNGMPVYFRVAFKPVSTLMMDQQTVNEAGEEVILKAKGRHDPCVVPRAVPIVEAMGALVIVEHCMLKMKYQ